MDSLWEYEHTYEISPAPDRRRDRLYARLYTAVPELENANPKFYSRCISDFKAETVPTNKITLLANPIEAKRVQPLAGYALMQLIEQAGERVIIQTPYATGNKLVLESFEKASEDAALTMVTNSALSSPNVLAFSNYHFQRRSFVETGAVIYEYQSSGSIHGKSAVIDGRLSVVGSLNLDDRSLYLDTETMLVIDSPEFAELLTGALEDIKAQSLRVGSDNKYLEEAQIKAPVPKKLLMGLVYIITRPFQGLL